MSVEKKDFLTLDGRSFKFNYRLNLPKRPRTTARQTWPTWTVGRLCSCTHLHCIIPWRLRMRWVYYMISAALFKDWYSLPIGCWIKHEAGGLCVCLRACVCLCVWWVGGWFSGGSGKEDEGILQTSLLEILYNSWSMHAFDLTHILTALLGVGKFPSSPIHMFFFVFLFVVWCSFLVFLSGSELVNKISPEKEMKVCSFQEEKAMQILPGTEMSQIHRALFRTHCCCRRCMTSYLLRLVFLRQLTLDSVFLLLR